MENTRSGSLADGLQFYLEGPAATFIESIVHAVLSITGTTSQNVSSKSLPYIFLYICSVNPTLRTHHCYAYIARAYNC
jgi:hypothetical protein